MAKPRMVSINIPFPGFYESWYSHDIDREEQQAAEYEAEEREDGERTQPEELRLTADELARLFYDHTEYKVAEYKIAAMYVDAFDYEAGDLLGLSVKDTRQVWRDGGFTTESYQRPSLRLRFEEMTSPREYNFETDRIFAEIPLAVARHMFAKSKEDKHATLAAVICRRFTSRSGFISFYANDVESWLATPLSDWDHNELGTLLLACLEMANGADWGDSEMDFRLYESVSDDGGIYQAWESAVDWPAFEKAREELREDKAADLRESDPERAAELGLLATESDGGWRHGAPVPHPAQLPLQLGDSSPA
jgi:hypothetical protein